MIDESVSKAQYMRILINTIKDDLSKIGHWFRSFINSYWIVIIFIPYNFIRMAQNPKFKIKEF